MEALPGCPIDWLLAGEPFVEYRARVDLLAQPENDPAVKAARERMLADVSIAGLIHELSAWPGPTVSNHKSAGQLFHKLTFLADVGVTADDPGMGAVAAAIMSRQAEEGPFQLPMNIPSHYGGTGRDVWAWALCDAPLLVYALAKMGFDADARVRAAVDCLAGLIEENGWPCAVAKELGTFRGPGKKDDPCPFACLVMLKALAQFADLRDGPAGRVGAETILGLWEDSRSRHPYMFFMGTDFRKLKAPFVWYDLLHVLEVLSRLPWVTGDVRFLDMLDTLRQKADASGRFTPESVWTQWKSWEFGQKKVPSRWVTLAAWRILDRATAQVLQSV